MTNEQLVLSAEEKIEELKKKYMDVLQPLAIAYNSSKISPSAEQLIECQRTGNAYFNYVENFVGNSGLLGAHVNGKWVTGFAETCHAVLESYILHIAFLRSHSSALGSSYQEPNSQAYANMQRMTKEYLEKATWENLERKYEENLLPVSGFKYSGASDLQKTPNWQLISGLIIGVAFLLALFVLAVMIPNPTSWQAFIFRGGFAISLAAIAAIIPGLLTVESRLQKMSIRATGAIAVFVIIWLVNPPALIGSDSEMPPSEKLIIDSHKTKIVIDRVELSNFHGVNEPYVVMVLKNTSEVTAKNINISFISESKEIFAKPDGVRELWRSRNLAIESQKEALIPVAPLSEYTGEIFENNPKARLLEFRLPDAKERPFSLDNKVCGNDPEIISCNYETRQRSTVVKISYESIFDEEITRLQQWFNIFLLGEPKIMRSNG